MSCSQKAHWLTRHACQVFTRASEEKAKAIYVTAPKKLHFESLLGKRCKRLGDLSYRPGPAESPELH